MQTRVARMSYIKPQIAKPSALGATVADDEDEQAEGMLQKLTKAKHRNASSSVSNPLTAALRGRKQKAGY